MGETTKYGSSSSLLDMKTKGYKGENEVEEFPCISPVDDEYLHQRQKYVPSQMLNRWRRAALTVSYASILCTLFLGIASFVISFVAKSSAAFGFAFDAFLDVCSSVVVIWRFFGTVGSTFSQERERRACIAIAICFILSSIGIFIRTIYSLSVKKQVNLFTGIEALSGISLVVLSILAWMKFIIADKLNSMSLHTDALNSTTGAVMALGTLLSSIVYQQDVDIWFVDASVGLCIALALLAYGLRLLGQILPSKGKLSLLFEQDF